MDLAEVDDVRNVAKLEGSRRMMDVLHVSNSSTWNPQPSLWVRMSALLART